LTLPKLAGSTSKSRRIDSPTELQLISLLLAKDLKTHEAKDHAELSQRATGLKRMLAAMLQS